MTHSNGTDDTANSIAYLTSLGSVRERCAQVYKCAQAGTTTSVMLDESKLPHAVDLVASLIRRDYAAPTDVPPHSRWRHFEMDKMDRVTDLIKLWRGQAVEDTECARRVLDLFVVSVLLDAGAGNAWSFKEHSTGKTYSRSEGLAIASLDMFKNGLFSSMPNQPFQVDAEALQSLTVEKLSKGFQITESNPMVGLQGRCDLLAKLGGVLSTLEFFKGPMCRPGNLIDHLLKSQTSAKEINIVMLWDIVQGLKTIWPSRLTLDGTPLGDVWRAACLESLPGDDPQKSLVPFHKLSQWLTYSLMEPLEKILGWKVLGKSALTGLAEYRNGGLFLDTGVLSLTPEALERGMANAVATQVEPVPLFYPDDQAVVEWRALTVALLDRVGDAVRAKFGMSVDQLELAKVLEGGTWKAGREIAAKLRPQTKGPPMNLISDGTVF